MKNEKLNEVFSINLRDIRRKKGYTQIKLSEISGVSQRVIDHYEKYVKRPSIDNVKKLADSLGVTDEELLGTTKNKPGKAEDVSFKIMKKVRVIEKLPVRDQNAIFHFINSLAEKNKIKGKI